MQDSLELLIEISLHPRREFGVQARTSEGVPVMEHQRDDLLPSGKLAKSRIVTTT